MRVDVLDHGYVEYIEAWGMGREGTADFEIGIIEAARQSTQGGFRGWAHDHKLLKFLHDNKHATPFEFAGLVIEVQAPIFVFREWHRHRTQSYNEMSARYTPLPDLYYVPDHSNVGERGRAASTNKQAAGVSSYNGQAAMEWHGELSEFYDAAEALYQRALAAGVPKELARITMPVGHYSRMRASANLRNWLAFLTLRMAPNAQWEIRQYADAVAKLIKHAFPETWRCFADAQAHVTSVESDANAYRGVCTCGWRGGDKDRISDDYAWTNAREEAEEHKRSHIADRGK